MPPFIMREYGEIRRQELLATHAHVALLKLLPSSPAGKRGGFAPLRMVTGPRVVLRGDSNRGIRYGAPPAFAGERP